MAVEYSLQTFNDIVTAIREGLGVQASDTNAVNKIKRSVNMYYMNEVVPFKRWTWLQKNLQVVHNAYFNVGTVSVAPASTTVTLNTPPNVLLGSFVGYQFAVDNSNKVYQVATHTAGSATITITSPYQETVNATANFKLWRDRIDLPIDAKETVEITHAEQPQPLIALGPQAFRKTQASSPKREGFPCWYNTDTFFDPSGNGSEDDRYRQVRLFPSITQTPVTLSIDYIEEAVPLVDDEDEPIIPLEDRIVLYYGAGAQAWSIIQRNEDMADRWKLKADQKLSRMAGDRDDGFDSPKMTPSGDYINSQRNAGLRRRRYGFASAGQSSVAIPSYLKNVIIAGGTLTADLNVNPGVLIDGVDISVLGNESALNSVDLTDNTANQVVAQWDITAYSVVHLDYSISRGAALEAGKITLVGLSGGASIAQGAIAEVNSAGTTLTTDISGGNLRLLASTSNTSTDAVFSYKIRSWLG